MPVATQKHPAAIFKTCQRITSHPWPYMTQAHYDADERGQNFLPTKYQPRRVIRGLASRFISGTRHTAPYVKRKRVPGLLKMSMSLPVVTGLSPILFTTSITTLGPALPIVNASPIHPVRHHLSKHLRLETFMSPTVLNSGSTVSVSPFSSPNNSIMSLLAEDVDTAECSGQTVRPQISWEQVLH